jgi:hypothetical protein
MHTDDWHGCIFTTGISRIGLILSLSEGLVCDIVLCTPEMLWMETGCSVGGYIYSPREWKHHFMDWLPVFSLLSGMGIQNHKTLLHSKFLDDLFLNMRQFFWSRVGPITICTVSRVRNSPLLWLHCHQSLIQLARHNRVQLICVPGHEGIVGNETADQLARTGSEHRFTGPEPACRILIGVAKKAVRDWMKRNHKKHWESTTGL